MSRPWRFPAKPAHLTPSYRWFQRTTLGRPMRSSGSSFYFSELYLSTRFLPSLFRALIQLFKLFPMSWISVFSNRIEPFEGLDALDVLFTLNDSVKCPDIYPGFQHRFFRLYVMFCVDSCSRSTC